MSRLSRRARAKRSRHAAKQATRHAVLSTMAENDIPIESHNPDFIANHARKYRMKNFESFEAVNSRDIRVCGKEHIGAYLRQCFDATPFPEIKSRLY